MSCERFWRLPGVFRISLHDAHTFALISAWARDEPPSPLDQHLPLASPATSIQPRPSQSGLSTTAESTGSISNHTATPYGQKDEPLWWMFTRRGRQEGPPQRSPSARHNWPTLNSKSGGSGEKRERPMRERARTTWLAGAQRVRHNLPEPAEGDPDPPSDEEQHRRSWGLHIPLPTPTPFTISQNRTPGWETPWSPRSNHSLNTVNGQGSNLGTHRTSLSPPNGVDETPDGRKRTKWYYRRKATRAFIINNNYVPLVRFSFFHFFLPILSWLLSLKPRSPPVISRNQHHTHYSRSCGGYYHQKDRNEVCYSRGSWQFAVRNAS